jgi:excisionase family DNA binding protein
MGTEALGIVIERLDRIEATLKHLVQERSAKEWYTTAEVAGIVQRSEYTVREWARKGQVKAEKATNGRGWLISHEELERIRNYGPLPCPKHVY